MLNTPQNPIADAGLHEIRVAMHRQGLQPIHLAALTGLHLHTIRNYIVGATSSRTGFQRLRKAVGLIRE